MRDFTVRVRDQLVTFQFGVHFVEGEGRLCWTLPGVEKLIGHGLWKRQFDARGDLVSKPVRVEMLMRKAALRH
jgi:hypothetical protein